MTSDVVLVGAPEPARSFSAVVSLRLLEGKSDIDGAARMAGLSVQGLQRRLRSTGYTYKDILEVARRTRAVMLLTQTSVSIAEIAFSLGYDEQANFTRAFNRWLGCSPSTFRVQYGIDSFVLPEAGAN
nr:helix-turn-helix transcriptional regulator [Marinicella sp. W31]MDC2877537.1 helix-turn-helix transcriptional regulator [Marinicella sp. W31]